MISESGQRVKFSLQRIGCDWTPPSVWRELAWVLQQTEKLGCFPVMEDGLVAGNAAMRFGNGILVTRSGRRPGELGPADFVEIVGFDPETWHADYFSVAEDVRPSSDTPLHWAALQETAARLGWEDEPLVSLHGHALADEAQARLVGAPISSVVTEFSTPADREALVALFESHPFPAHSVYVRRGHGFFILAETVQEAVLHAKDIISRASNSEFCGAQIPPGR